jgi:Acetyltransferase (GNAT) domain
VLRWAASAVDGTRVLSVENLSRSDHRGSGTFRLRIEGPAARTTDMILKVPVPRWIDDGMVITNARGPRCADGDDDRRSDADVRRMGRSRRRSCLLSARRSWVAVRAVLRRERVPDVGVPEPEIGWHVRKAVWNQGIATEAATAGRDLASRRFDLLRLVAIIHRDHVASRRVAEKIGMRHERTMIIEDDYPAAIYATAFNPIRATS